MANINSIPVHTILFPRPYYLLIQDPEVEDEYSTGDDSDIQLADTDEDHLQPPPPPPNVQQPPPHQPPIQLPMDEPQVEVIPSDGIRLRDNHGPQRDHDFIIAVYLALEYLGREGQHPTHAIQDRLRDDDAIYRCTLIGYRDTMMRRIAGSRCNGFLIQRDRIGRQFFYSLHQVLPQQVPPPQVPPPQVEEDIL